MPTWGATMLTLENVSLTTAASARSTASPCMRKEGELVVLLGANGAGKSSIFLTTSGLHRAAGGSIRFGDQELVGMKPVADRAARRGAVPRGPQAVPADVGAEEPDARRLRAPPRQRRQRERLDEVLALFPILAQKKDDPAGSLSRRPAADGGHRPRADGPAAGAAARRTVARPGAAGGQAGVRGDPAHQPRRHHGAAGRAERLSRR